MIVSELATQITEFAKETVDLGKHRPLLFGIGHEKIWSGRVRLMLSERLHRFPQLIFQSAHVTVVAPYQVKLGIETAPGLLELGGDLTLLITVLRGSLVGCRDVHPASGDLFHPFIHIVDRISCAVLKDELGQKHPVVLVDHCREQNPISEKKSFRLGKIPVVYLCGDLFGELPENRDNPAAIEGSILAVLGFEKLGEIAVHPFGGLTLTSQNDFIEVRVGEVRLRILEGF